MLERILLEQISVHFNAFLSDQQRRCWKGYSTQHCLLNLLESWENSVDKGKSFGALLADLSKAFDFLNHELLNGKFNAYEITPTALRLIHDYLSKRKQWINIDDNYSSWSKILFGDPQGSILVPLLFHVFLANLVFVVKHTDIARYADDSASFIGKNNIDNIIASLEQVSDALFNLFNRLKNNVDKCHVLVSTTNPQVLKLETTQ